MVVMNISRSRKARNIARPTPSAEAVEETGGEASAGPSRIDTIKKEYWARQRLPSAGPAIVAEVVTFDFKPIPPITPPPDHLRRELTPKLEATKDEAVGEALPVAPASFKAEVKPYDAEDGESPRST